MTEEYQRTRMSVDVVNSKTMTVGDLLLYMMERKLSQVVIPFVGGECDTPIFFHVAAVVDQQESAKLSDDVKKRTYAAIVKVNAKYGRKE